jgi:hypothetical protein
MAMRAAWLAAGASVLALAQWPQFRGPNGSGVAEEKNLPVDLNPARNVVWRTALPPGHSSPVLARGRIFLTAVESERLWTIALDRQTGGLLWKREAPRPRREPMQQINSPASPTPATDGESVFVFFGDFGLLAYDRNGKELWRLPLGPFNNANGHGSSPIVVDDMVVLICDQDTGSYLLAVDKQSGKVKWKTARPEVTRGYATPAVYQREGQGKELLAPGSYQLISYDAATGEKLWWVNGMAWQMKGVPVTDGEVIYINGWEIGGDFESAPSLPEWEDVLRKHDLDQDGVLSPQETPALFRQWYRWGDLDMDGRIDARDWNFFRLQRSSRNNLCAVRPNGRGDQTSNVLWRYSKSLPYVPSPLLYRGVLYLVKDGGIVTSLDPRNGSAKKVARLPGAMEQYWASPVAGGGKIYTVSQACKVSVIEAGPKWELLRVNDLEDECFATPVIADGGLYVRSRQWLYFFRGK